MEIYSDPSSGKIVAARVRVDGQEFAVVAVSAEVAQDRILAAKILRYYANRLFAGLPALLAYKDELGRMRYSGGIAADWLERADQPMIWKTLYEDGPSESELAV